MGLSNISVPKLELGPLDVARLVQEDLNYNKSGRPMRVAVRQAANVDIRAAGSVVDGNGYRTYQYEVDAPGAAALSAEFDQLQLAAGARVFLYNAAQTVLIGPITSQHNLTTGRFNSGHVIGDRLIIELQEPMGVVGQSQLHLSGVANFYQTKGPFGGLQPSDACQNNLICFSDYQTQADGVGLILINDGAGSSFTCSGSMVNDARQSFRSFFLTAFHCIDFDADQVSDLNERNSTASWTFYFKYQSATCTPTQDDNVYLTINGATYRAGGAATDFTLLELNAQAPQSEAISYLGWDRSNALPTSVFGIHHPNGSVKKISFGGATSTVGVTYASGGVYSTGSGTSFLQLRWNSGVTEGGSSGSALFNGTSRRVIGQLLGGSSSCTPVSSLTAPDQYGRLFTSWTGGGTADTRLSNWLDPTAISGNTTDLAVPVVSGPAAFTNTGTFSLNTGLSSIVSWSITSGAGTISPASGTGNTASLTALATASNYTITFTVNAGQTYPIRYARTFNASVVAPVLTITGLAAIPTAVCVGSTATFTATVGNLTGGTYSYTLSNGSGPISGTSASASFSQAVSSSGSGVQSFTLRVSSGGQSAQATTTLTVNALPTAGLVNNGPLTCSQTSATLTASATGATSYSLSNGQTNSTGRFVVSTPGTYTATIANAGGCTATATVSGNTIPPTALLTPSSATLTCTNPTVTLTASGGGSYSFNTGATANSIVVSSAGTYSVLVTGANGCTALATATVLSDTTSPTLTLSVSTPNPILDSSVSLTASPGFSSYAFSGPGISPTIGGDNTLTLPAVTTANTGSFSVVATASNGCTATAITTLTVQLPSCTTFVTVKSGRWDDPTVWFCGIIPARTDVAEVNHALIIPAAYTAQVRSLRYGLGGQLTYQTGASLQLGF